MATRHINPQGLHFSPAFSQAVVVEQPAKTIYIGGQNGVGPDGTVVGPGLGDQTRRALENLRTCVEAAGASITDVVKWTILCVEGASLQEGASGGLRRLR